MPNYILSARKIRNGQFIAEPGKPRFLKSPGRRNPIPGHEITRNQWIDEVRDVADGQGDDRVSNVGDILIFVHGYNNSAEIIRQRHEALQKTLAAKKWKGLVVSFDWPSDDYTLNYYEDRADAAKTARYLVDEGIGLIMKAQRAGCGTNIHLLGHSTGAYVIMEAFSAADKEGSFYKSDWRIGQVAFIGGDVASRSIAADSESAAPMYKRIMRLTNYQNGFDFVLAASNAKRLGTAPRVGRVGLGENPHPKTVNVDCSNFYDSVDSDKQTLKFGTWAHSWHIGNPVFALDLAMTLEGRIDRNYLPTRKDVNGELHLQKGSRPRFEQKLLNLNEPRFIG